MPLSEHEQRLLEEMERGLYHNDADFVATVSSSSSRPNFRMIVIGALVGIAGIAGIVVGVATRLPLVGVLGFIIMFVGALLALTRSRGLEPTAGLNSSSGTGGRRSQASFMERMNERWDNRQDGHSN